MSTYQIAMADRCRNIPIALIDPGHPRPQTSMSVMADYTH